MKTAAKLVLGDSQSIHMLPRWVTSVHGQDIDSVAFTSGAALAMLDVVDVVARTQVVLVIGCSTSDLDT